jgi:hypothetical protein
MCSAPPATGMQLGISCEQAFYLKDGWLVRSLLELLSGLWVISPEDGLGMTLLGHAGAQDRVVSLKPEVSADPLGDGGGRGAGAT